MSPDDVLSWWFGDWSDDVPLAEGDPQLARWWSKSPEIDDEIRARFAALHAEVAAGRRDDWERTARGALAKVLVLDQFSRVLYRDRDRAFRWDGEARAVTQRALEQAHDRELSLIERLFLYLPLMHAEDRATHRRALALFSGLAEEAEEAGLARADYYRGTVGWELRHKEIIDRFGRYPHRNFVLERTSTPEELEFLKQEGSSF